MIRGTRVLAVCVGLSFVGATLIVPSAVAAPAKAGAPCSPSQVGTFAEPKQLAKKGLRLICSYETDVADQTEDPKGRPDKSPSKKEVPVWVPAGIPLEPDLVDYLRTGKGDYAAVLTTRETPIDYKRSENDPCRIGTGADGAGLRNVSLTYGKAGEDGRDSEGYARTVGTLRVGMLVQLSSDSFRRSAGTWGVPNEAGEFIVTDVAGIIRDWRTDFKNVTAPFFAEQSYGKLKLELAKEVIVQSEDYTLGQWNGWVSAPRGTTSRRMYVADGQRAWEQQPASLTNDLDMLWVVQVGRTGSATWNPPQQWNNGVPLTLGGPSVGTFDLNGRPFSGLVNTGSAGGGMLLAHEIGHGLRLPDLYERGSSNPVQRRLAARVSKMANGNLPTGFLGWERYINRWIDDIRVECLTFDELKEKRLHTVKMYPIQRFPYFDDGFKRMTVIPVPDADRPNDPITRAIVVESWRPWGVDRSFTETGGGDGLLVYTVDANDEQANDANGEWPWADAPVVLYRNDKSTVRRGNGPLEECQRDNASSACRQATQDLVRQDAFLVNDSYSSRPYQDATYELQWRNEQCSSGKENVTISINNLARSESLVELGWNYPDLRNGEAFDEARITAITKGCA